MKSTKILPKHHTGKIVHHHHTSYGALVVLAILMIAPLTLASRAVVSADAYDPVTSTETIHAVVQGEPPATAPVIDNLSNGQIITSDQSIVVSGSCPANTLIKIFKNEVFAGSTFCRGGRFSIPVDLFIGVNTLIARAYNTNDVVGPEGVPVVVNRQVPGMENVNFPITDQFVITSDLPHKGINIGDEISIPVTIKGGKPPYAISVGWGDGKTDLISRAGEGAFMIKHRYSEGGKGEKNSFDITITGSDYTGAKSFIQLTLIVNGSEPSVVGSVKRGYNLSTVIRISWLAFAVVLLLIIAFWLGERRRRTFHGPMVGKI